MATELEWRLVKGPGVSSAVIGWFGAGYYSHVDWLGPDGMLWGARSDVIAGIPAGVQRRPQGYATFTANTAFRLPVLDFKYQHYLDFMSAQIGKPYAKAGLVDTYLLGRDWRSDSDWWCSELVAAAAEKARVTPHLWDGFNKITPGDWALVLSAIGASYTELGP
jgi:hypothetical protein